jgi:O-glycosyl hydrolase
MRCSTVGENNYEGDVNVSTAYQRVAWKIDSKGAMSGFNFDLGYAADTFFIDDVSLISTNSLGLIPNGTFETGVDGWSKINGATDCFSFDDANAYDGSGCLKVVNASNNPNSQWSTQIHTSYRDTPLPAGDYSLTYYIKCASGIGSVRISTGNNYESDQQVTTTYTQKTYTFTSAGDEDGLNIDLGKVANTYYVDDMELTLVKAAVDTSYSPVSVVVTPTSKYQKVIGIGGGLVYYQNWIEKHTNKVAIYDTLFSGLGLSALRLGNWAQDTTVKLSTDSAIVTAAKARLGNNFIIEMSSWSAPASLKANASLNGSNGGVKASLLKDSNGYVYDKFGQWWRASLEHYHAAGIYPDYISIQNEPDMDASYEAMLLNPTETESIASYGKALAAVYKHLKGMSSRPDILGAEPLGIGWNDLQNYVNSAETDTSLLDGLCFHYYHCGANGHTSRYYYPADFIPAMTGIADSYYGKKPLFMTENCSMGDPKTNDAVYTAWIISNSFNYNRANGYFFWNIGWGNDNSGCVQVENPDYSSSWTTKQGYIVHSDYHGLRHFSKFVRPGMICVGDTSSSSDVISSAFVDSTGSNYAIVLINSGVTHKVSVSLPVKDSKGQALTYSGRIIRTVPSLSEWSNEEGGYELGAAIDMPAKSVVTLVLKAKSSTGTSSVSAATSQNWISMSDNSLYMNVGKSGVANITVMNVSGQVLTEQKTAVENGLNVISLPTLPKGVLMVQTVINGYLHVDKVINK